jgi:predicted LPLAT superfamily acyltransferase
MPSWQGKSKGSPIGYRIFVFILKTGGLAPAYLLLRFVVLYYLFFSFKTSKTTFFYFRRKIGYGMLSSINSLCQNYYLLGQSIVDKVVVMSGIPNKFTFNFDGEDHLLRIASQKKGGLLLSAHVGNWEIAGHLLQRINTSVHIVIYDGERQQIKEYMESITGKRRINLIVIKEDLSHIFEISEAFKQNELVCMHADRFMEGSKTIVMPFLGQEAKFPLGPFLLAAKFKVPVSFVFAMKESKRHYHVFASLPKTYAGTKEDAIQNVLGDFVSEMENKVKRYPLQWYNYYNFWQ